jgi:uncharacterized lipoprotein YajG
LNTRITIEIQVQSNKDRYVKEYFQSRDKK